MWAFNRNINNWNDSGALHNFFRVCCSVFADGRMEHSLGRVDAEARLAQDPISVPFIAAAPEMAK
jgi:hypothetical protein